ncbi:hypothetical protein HYN49_13525 [Flavobacterium pallidum]|uniref:Uncharacterized protein n=1 Tax=Flavobacterium pallidum TaxID=2172098 RepID=A0A2S1SKF8_9FLAO|nr:hypothetical protein HYN49_13525 [Flavobacterium pallidum]
MKHKIFQFFEKRMLMVILLFIICLSYFTLRRMLGINRTVNWAWDLTNAGFALTYLTCFIFLIGYGILAILKHSTQKYLSILHSAIILLSFLIDDFYNFQIIAPLALLSFIIFIINIYWAIKNRKRKTY